jgi:hypothetical protein
MKNLWIYYARLFKKTYGSLELSQNRKFFKTRYKSKRFFSACTPKPNELFVFFIIRKKYESPLLYARA